jgi:hypothetical protein
LGGASQVLSFEGEGGSGGMKHGMNLSTVRHK